MHIYIYIHIYVYICIYIYIYIHNVIVVIVAAIISIVITWLGTLLILASIGIHMLLLVSFLGCSRDGQPGPSAEPLGGQGRAGERGEASSSNACMLFVALYVLCIYIYIYIEREREKERYGIVQYIFLRERHSMRGASVSDPN